MLGSSGETSETESVVSGASRLDFFDATVQTDTNTTAASIAASRRYITVFTEFFFVWFSMYKTSLS